MKLNYTAGFMWRGLKCVAFRGLVFFGIIAGFTSLLNAQDAVVAPAPVVAPYTDAPSVEINAGDETVSAVPGRFQYGFRFGLRGVYDDNINLTPFDFNKVSGYSFVIEPAVTIGYGDIARRAENFGFGGLGNGQGNYVRLDYQPSIFIFEDSSNDAAVQHLIRLEAQYRFPMLTLNLSQDVQLFNGTDVNSTTGPGLLTNGANVDVAGRTQVDVYRTHLGGSYSLTGKTFLSGAVDYTVADYDSASLIGSQTLFGNLFVNYNYSPKLVIGIGGSAGYDWVDSSTPSQTFEQANLRMTYEATGKISLYASGGVEFRQFEDDSRDTYVSPVYELGATYRPFDGTTISLRGNSRVLNSAVLVAQDFVPSNIVLGLRQRLFRRIFLGVTAGYEHADYFSTIRGVTATREDNYYFISPGIDITITKSWSVGAYYVHRQNDSSFDSFAFDDNQVGVRTAISF